MTALQKKPKGGELKTDEKMRNKRISIKRDSKHDTMMQCIKMCLSLVIHD
ncbi:MAG: hypothetical protein LBR15_00210 [Methanobrevibacter sp.]|nr:hypothetical protein [Candidatus Methanovirga australis]